MERWRWRQSGRARARPGGEREAASLRALLRLSRPYVFTRRPCPRAGPQRLWRRPAIPLERVPVLLLEEGCAHRGSGVRVEGCARVLQHHQRVLGAPLARQGAAEEGVEGRLLLPAGCRFVHGRGLLHQRGAWGGEGRYGGASDVAGSDGCGTTARRLGGGGREKVLLLRLRLGIRLSASRRRLRGRLGRCRRRRHPALLLRRVPLRCFVLSKALGLRKVNSCCVRTRAI